MGRKNTIWNISNGLSLFRIFLVIPGAYFFWNEQRDIAIGIGVLAYITDILDGWAARKFDEVSELGKIMDPIADKIFVGMVAIVLILKGQLPLWFVAVVLLRDAIIVSAGMYVRKKINFVLPSNFPGKAAALSVAATLCLMTALVDTAITDALLWFSFGLLMGSLVQYGERFHEVIIKKKPVE
jgi:CDP-diacylglycerol--glycerol-3-phosphate 3-phosphatidyltransferase